jgi:hypothetical protein
MANILQCILKTVIGKNMTKITLSVNTISFLEQKVISNCQRVRIRQAKLDSTSGNQEGPVERERPLHVSANYIFKIDHRDFKKLHVYRESPQLTLVIPFVSNRTVAFSTPKQLPHAPSLLP